MFHCALLIYQSEPHFQACSTAIESRHEISHTVVSATSKALDQHVRMRSLIRAFATRLNIL